MATAAATTGQGEWACGEHPAHRPGYLACHGWWTRTHGWWIRTRNEFSVIYGERQREEEVTPAKIAAIRRGRGNFNGSQL